VLYFFTLRGLFGKLNPNHFRRAPRQGRFEGLSSSNTPRVPHSLIFPMDQPPSPFGSRVKALRSVTVPFYPWAVPARKIRTPFFSASSPKAEFFSRAPIFKIFSTDFPAPTRIQIQPVHPHSNFPHEAERDFPKNFLPVPFFSFTVFQNLTDSRLKVPGASGPLF